MDHIYRDNNLDKMRADLVVRDQRIALLEDEKLLLEKKITEIRRRGMPKHIARAVIVTVAVAGFIATGNGWLIALALVAATS